MDYMCCIGRPNKRMQDCWLEKNPDLTGKLCSSTTCVCYLTIRWQGKVTREGLSNRKYYWCGLTMELSHTLLARDINLYFFVAIHSS